MMHPYNWKPVKQTIIKDSDLAEVIHQKGYAVVSFLNAEELSALDKLYEELHSIDVKDGGMFYSVYSKNTDYRKKVHFAINEILTDALNRHLQDFRVMLNAFVIKSPGKKSEFNIHQDATGLDEFKFSPLSVWIPLCDITPENGAMCLMPKSHHVFSPYRGISFPSPYSAIERTVKQFLHPVYLKRGEAIFFDNRLVHNSMNNLTRKNRVVVVSSIFPKNAELLSCFKDTSENADGKIELIKQTDDFLLEYTGFLENCHLRPDVGNTVEYVDDKYPLLTAEEFIALTEEYEILPYEGFVNEEVEQCNMIGEPDTVVKPEKQTLVNKLKKIFQN